MELKDETFLYQPGSASLYGTDKDHRGEIIKNSFKMNIINNLLCALCGLFLQNFY
jgi:hypothetical protein